MPVFPAGRSLQALLSSWAQETFCGLQLIQYKLTRQNSSPASFFSLNVPSCLSFLPTEEPFKGKHPFGTSHSKLSFSQIFGSDFLRSRCSIETTHQRSHSLEPVGPGKAGFLQVFLTHPGPESASAPGRLQPFVTWPARAWLWLTGDGCVNQVSLPIQKGGG